MLTLALNYHSSAPGTVFDFPGILLDLENCDNLLGVDIWQNHLLNLLLDVENIFAIKRGWKEPEAMDLLFIQSVRRDLYLLQLIYDFKLLQLALSLKEEHAQSGLFNIPAD